MLYFPRASRNVTGWIYVRIVSIVRKIAWVAVEKRESLGQTGEVASILNAKTASNEVSVPANEANGMLMAVYHLKHYSKMALWTIN